MKSVKTLLAAALTTATLASHASPVVLDFETSPPLTPELVGSPYLGITFSNSAWVSAGKDVAAGAYGSFRGQGGTVNKGAVTLDSDPYDPDVDPALSFIIEVADGFNGSFSLIFGGADNARASIKAFGEGGVALTAFDTSAAASNLCTDQKIVCDWVTLSMNLGSTAVYKIEVTGVDGKQWFDNFTFGNLLADDPGGNVPEPSGIALSLAALGGVAWTRRRSKR